MYQTNPTEIFRERQLALLREAEERRLARQLRAARSKERPRSERRMAGGFEEESWLQILWSTGPVP
jgi:hypothetical protein